MEKSLLLTVRQAAAALAVSAGTVRRLMKAGEIPVVRVRGRVLVSRDHLDDYVRRSTSGTTPGDPRPSAPRALFGGLRG